MKKTLLLTELLNGLLALLFIYTAASKLIDLTLFEREIRNQAFSDALKPLITYGLPPFELVTAGLILIPVTRPIGLILYIGTMTIFSVYVGLVTFHYYDRVPCSCAGIFRQMGWPAHLVFNIFFTMLAITALWLTVKQRERLKLKTVA